MPSVECLREFVNNRLTAAAEEIFGVFLKTIVEYEEEIDRQRKLLDIAWKPEIKLHRIELSQQHVCKEEEALTDQQIFNQERNSSLDQEEPKPPQIKEEQEELCTSQEGEQLVVKVETDDFMVTSTDEETDYSKPERDSDQQLLSNNSDEAESQNQKGELSQQHVCKEEEALTDQHVFNQERNSSLDQEEPKPPQIKEEQEELCTSQEGEQLVVKLETGDFMVTSTDEETDYSEPERDSDQQLLSNNSDEAESQNQKGGEHGDSGSTRDAEPALTIGYHTSESYSHNVNNSNWSEMQHNDLTGKKSFKCDTYGTPVWTSLDQEEPKPPQIIEEQEELFSSQEGEQLVVKLETDDFMLTPAELESDQQLLSNNSDEAESQNQKGGEHGDSGSIRDAEAEPTIRHCNNESHSNKTSMSEIQHNLTGKKPFLCDTCGKCVRSKQSLQLHLRIHTGEKPYSCKTCGKDFRIGNDLKVHMRSHTGEKPYCCNTCGKDFRSSSDLKAHIRSHTGEKPYPCKFCGKSFGHISTLMVHKRIHTGEKPYSCNTCGECFLDISRLKCHMGEHTGEKPFLCNTCGKTFRFRNHFKVHMRSHTGERPYTCTTCGKGFVSGSKLTTHLRSHTGERPYTCTTCGKGFVSSGKLTDHLRSHSGERPHICETCGKGFKRSSHLKTHLKIHTD